MYGEVRVARVPPSVEVLTEPARRVVPRVRGHHEPARTRARHELARRRVEVGKKVVERLVADVDVAVDEHGAIVQPAHDVR